MRTHTYIYIYTYRYTHFVDDISPAIWPLTFAAHVLALRQPLAGSARPWGKAFG